MSKEKDQITRKYLDKRNQVTTERQAVDSSLIRVNLEHLVEYKNSQIKMFYISYDKEVLTFDLINDHLEQEGKTTLVPLVEKTDIQIHAVKIGSLNELEVGNYNIMEPQKNNHNIVEPETIDVVVVPGIAFDPRGGRIGFGKGYYDRFLKKTKATRIALAYDFQVLPKVPQGHYDVPMDYIITPSKTIKCEGDLNSWR